MAQVRIIPCLDVRDGRVVKGIQFQDLRDAGEPAEQAAAYALQGADEIVMLDVTATLEDRGARLRAVDRIRRVLNVPLTVGGGLNCSDQARRLLGAGEILLTSWDRDGTGEGYDLELLAAVRRAVDVPVIASGGGSTPDQMAAAVAAGADAVLAASIFHDGHWQVGDLKRELQRRGVEVRP
jgi:imidazole glycerol phosphate synthase subunit HisF